eukprot:225319-Prorocentrum_minimum.AAC.1
MGRQVGNEHWGKIRRGCVSKGATCQAIRKICECCVRAVKRWSGNGGLAMRFTSTFSTEAAPVGASRVRDMVALPMAACASIQQSVSRV